MASGSPVNPIRPNASLIRPDRLPVPARADSRAVVTIDPGEKAPLVKGERVQDGGAGSRLIGNPVDPMMIQGLAADEKHRAHAAAEQSYRRTSALGWQVHRTVDFEV